MLEVGRRNPDGVATVYPMDWIAASSEVVFLVHVQNGRSGISKSTTPVEKQRCAYP
jgi:hypothetical protein